VKREREPGFYWVLVAHAPGLPIVARWTGRSWMHATSFGYPRVRKVLSERLTPPTVKR
jgi:hypothetical protein